MPQLSVKGWRRAASSLTLVAAVTFPAVIAVGGTAAAAASSGQPGTAAASASGGTLRGWGLGAFGQLGDGTTTDSGTPVRVKLPKGVKITQVRAGCRHTLALTSKDRVLAWGSNIHGELGNGSTVNSAIPVRAGIPASTKITAVRAGCDFSLALTSKGHVLAWGYNAYGQLGNGTTTDSGTPVRVKLPRHARVTAISAGQYFGLARTSKGHVLAWGANTSGQLGNASTANSDTPVRVQLPAGAKVTAVAGGYDFGLALTPSGLFGWGDNVIGQLGDGTTTSRDTPVQSVLIVHAPQVGHVTSVFAGCAHTLVLYSGGLVMGWGGDKNGQLGDGSTTSRSTPIAAMLPAGARVTAVTAGCADSYALTAKGHVLAWGYDAEGQLGDGGTTSRDTPVRVELPGGWRASALGAGPGASHALAIVHRR